MLGHIPHRKEVVQALGHFLIVHIDKAVVHPVAGKGAAVGALALGDLIFMVGEYQVLTAAMQVDGLAQVGTAHGAALDVPAGAAHSIGAFPGRLAGLGCLPDSKVRRVLLQVVLHAAAQLPVAALQVIQLQMAELAVLGVALDPEVNIPILCHIRMTRLHQVGHDGQDLRDMLGGAGLYGGCQAVQTSSILEILGLKALSHLLHGSAFFLALRNELIINIRDIGHILHLCAPVLQVTAQGVEHDQRPCVANVDIVVDGGAADIDAVLPRGLGDKFFFLTGQGIENLHRSLSFLCDKHKPQRAKTNASGQNWLCQLIRRRFLCTKPRFHFCLSLKRR